MPSTTIGRATWTDDDGSGTTGTILNNARLQGDVYDKVDAIFAAGAGLAIAGPVLERGRTTPLGEWVNVTAGSVTMSASTGTWTNTGTFFYQYALIGKVAILNIVISASTTSAAPTYLRITMPAAIIPVLANANYLGTIYNGTSLVASAVNMNSGGGGTVTWYPTVAQTGTFPASNAISVNFSLAYAIP